MGGGASTSRNDDGGAGYTPYADEAYAKEARAWRAAVREEFFDTFTPGNAGSNKIDIVHFRRRKDSMDKVGHRQPYTRIKIEKIEVGS